MQERVWVKDFFVRWSRKGHPTGDDKAFYQVLRQFNQKALVVTALDIRNAEPVSDEDKLLLDLWRAWNESVQGNTMAGHQKIKKIAKQLKQRPEPFVLMGASSLLRGDRNTAYKAIRRAWRLNPRDQQVQLLLQRLGERRDPVLSFLERSNPVNISLGKLRAKMFPT